jgi:tetratricopeptide (TPR) repeat protein
MAHDPETSFQKILNACQGYLQLGMIEDAWNELNTVPPGFQDRPEVLQLRTWIHMRRKEWLPGFESAARLCGLAPHIPIPFIDAAYCLHELKRTSEAKQILMAGPPELAKFPLYHYNLACYEACLGNLDSARRYLKTAIGLHPPYREEALQDPDLKPLWNPGPE